MAESGGILSNLLQGDKGFATPDISRAQALAVGQAAVALLVVLGFDVPEDVQTAIVALAAVLGVSLPASDAYLRQARAKNADKIAEARRITATTGPELAHARARLAQAELELAEAHAVSQLKPPSP